MLRQVKRLYAPSRAFPPCGLDLVLVI